MFRFLTYISIAFMTSGCATVFGFNKRVSEVLKPVDANRFEAGIHYKCNGHDEYDFSGMSVCQIKAGELFDFWVKLPPSKGQIVIRTTRNQIVDDFKASDDWYHAQWKMQDENDSIRLVVGISGEGTGRQKAEIHPYVLTDRHPKLKGVVDYFCFEDDATRLVVGQGVCQQPVGAVVTGSFHLDSKKSGFYLLDSQGCDISSDSNLTHPFPVGTSEVKFNFSRSSQGYCTVGLFAKYDDGSRDEARLYLEFWNFDYVPLVKPTIQKQDSDRLTACAAQGYAFYEVNDRVHRNCWFDGHCAAEKWLPDGTGYITVWDQDGRVTSIVTRKP